MAQRIAGKRGKLEAEVPVTGYLHEYLTRPLPVPPSSFDYSPDVKQYPMALNDQLGDCTIAGVIHLLQLAYAEVGEVFTYPGDDKVKKAYMWLTGGQDTGCVEKNVLGAWQRYGLFNTKIAAYAPVNIKNRAHFNAALYAFGAVYLGVEMPADADQQFEERKPWSLDNPPAEIEGGHCVVATGSNALGVDVITWGATQPVLWDWFDAYCSEAWVIVPEVFVEADHGPINNINIQALQADLKVVN